MAYANVNTGSRATGTGSLSPTFTAATSGNLLVAWINNSGVGGTDITSSSTGWSMIPTVSTIGGAVAIGYKVSTGGETTATFNGAGGASLEGLVAEFSGGATSSPLDQSNMASGSVSPLVVANSAADAAAGELVVSVLDASLTKAGTNTSSSTYNNGATATSPYNDDAGSTVGHVRFSWGTTTGNSAATQDSQASGSKNVASLLGAIATFRLRGVVMLPHQFNPVPYMSKPNKPALV